MASFCLKPIAESYAVFGKFHIVRYLSYAMAAGYPLLDVGPGRTRRVAQAFGQSWIVRQDQVLGVRAGVRFLPCRLSRNACTGPYACSGLAPRRRRSVRIAGACG